MLGHLKIFIKCGATFVMDAEMENEGLNVTFPVTWRGGWGIIIQVWKSLGRFIASFGGKALEEKAHQIYSESPWNGQFRSQLKELKSPVPQVNDGNRKRSEIRLREILSPDS